MYRLVIYPIVVEAFLHKLFVDVSFLELTKGCIKLFWVISVTLWALRWPAYLPRLRTDFGNFFWWYLGLNSVLHAYLIHVPSPFVFILYLRQGLLLPFPRMSLNLKLSSLCYPSSWDYRCEPPNPAYFVSVLSCTPYRCDSILSPRSFYL
jgi:hypothetical protein